MKTDATGIYIRDDNGKYRVDSMYRGFHITGTFPKGTEGFRLAKRYLKSEKDKINKGKVSKERKTLKEVYQYIDSRARNKGKKKEQSTINSDNIFYKHIAKYLGKDTYMDTLKRQHIESFQDRLAKDVSEKTGKPLSVTMQRKAIELMRRILNTAYSCEWMGERLAGYLDAPEQEGKDPDILTEEETEILFKQAEETFYNTPNRLGVLALGVYGGLRRGEMCGLQWKHVDFENHKLFVEQQKLYVGREYRITDPKTRASKMWVPMELELENILKRMYDRIKTIAKPEHFVLTKRKGRYTGNSVCVQTPMYELQSLSEQVSKKYGIEIIVTPHKLRRTCGTRVAKKEGIQGAADHLRHEKPDITLKRYVNHEAMQEERLRKMYPKTKQSVEQKGA